MADWHCSTCMAPRDMSDEFCPDCDNPARTIDTLRTANERLTRELEKAKEATTEMYTRVLLAENLHYIEGQCLAAAEAENAELLSLLKRARQHMDLMLLRPARTDSKRGILYAALDAAMAKGAG